VKKVGIVKCFLAICLAAAMLISLLKGAHFPNLWSYSHYLIPCSDPVLKRTLVGCAVELVGDAELFKYQYFAAGSIFISAVFFSCLLVTAIRVGITGPGFAFVFGLAFFLSPSLVFTANIPGYFDFIGVCILLFIVALRRPMISLLSCLVLFSASLLIHEAIVIIFFPLAVAILWRRFAESGLPKSWGMGLFGMCIGLLLLSIYVSNSLIDPANIAVLHQLAQAKTEVELPLDVFKIYERDISDNQKLASDVFYLFVGNLRSGVIWYLTNILPLAIVLTAANIFMLRSKFGWLFALAAGLAPLSGLVLVFIGYDWIRWASWATVNCFLLFCILILKKQHENVMRSPVWLLVGVGLCVHGVSVDYPLLNGKVRIFPYSEVVEYWAWVSENRKLIPPLTERWMVSPP